MRNWQEANHRALSRDNFGTSQAIESEAAVEEPTIMDQTLSTPNAIVPRCGLQHGLTYAVESMEAVAKLIERFSTEYFLTD